MSSLKKVLWICGLPNEVRQSSAIGKLSNVQTAAWSWILGSLPPPNNIELHILCPVVGLVKKVVHFEFCGGHWHCFRQERGELLFGWIRFYLQIRSFVKQLSPSIIEGWGGESGCGLLATYCSSTAVVSVQGQLRMLKKNMQEQGMQMTRWRTLRGRMGELFEWLAYRRSCQLITESVASNTSLLKLYGHESFIVPQALRTEFLHHILPAAETKGLMFLYVGEMVDRKGAMDTLLAFRNMKNKDARLVMIGSGTLSRQVDTFIREQGLYDRVRHIEKCGPDEILAQMDRARFFILPSYGDTGPTALKEALSQGLYPICYDNTGPHTFITEYGFGRLCPTGDWSTLQTAMDEACEDRHELARVGGNVAAAVRRDLSALTVWAKRLSVYEKLNESK